MVLSSQLLFAGPLNFSILAETGDLVTTPSGMDPGTGVLTSPASTMSLNDQGQVAFTGQYSSGANSFASVFRSDGTTGVVNLAGSLNSTTRQFSFPWINNAGDVVARDVISTTFFVRRYNNAGPTTLAKTGDSGPLGTYNSVTLPSIANDGSVAFVGLTNNSATTGLFLQPAGVEGTEVKLRQFPAGSGGLRPAIADGQQVIVRDGGTTTSPITIFQANGAQTTIASTPTYSAIGSSPGISDDGSAAAFYGVDANGPGIFVTIRSGVTPVTTRVAGISGNGRLDPGETWTDLNGNHIVDPGEDIGGFSSFQVDSKVAINRASQGSQSFNVLFAANDSSGTLGAFTAKINSQTNVVSGVAPIIKSGATVGSLTAINNVQLYDSLNNRGVESVWVSTASGQQAILRTEPPQTSSTLLTQLLATIHPQTVINPMSNRKGIVFSIDVSQLPIASLARAAEVIGVDHFNWISRIIGIPNGPNNTWSLRDPAGTVLTPPVIDPLPNATGMFTQSSHANRTEFADYDPPVDGRDFYYNDPASSDPRDFSNLAMGQTLTFRDYPVFPADFLVPGDYVSFETELVGVQSNGTVVHFSSPGTKIRWKTNNAFNGSGGIYFSSLDPTVGPAQTSGDIYDIAVSQLGDIDGNGAVNGADITALMAALADISGYQSSHVLTNSDLVAIADLNGDGLVTNADLQGLINLLANGGGSGGGDLAAVPEPASIVLLGIGAAGLLWWRRLS
jgi:hypothetical protein